MDENKFINGEREIRKKYNILLLAELLNYYANNGVNFEVNNIVNSLQDSIIYEAEEKDELVKEAKKILREKYNIEL